MDFFFHGASPRFCDIIKEKGEGGMLPDSKRIVRALKRSEKFEVAVDELEKMTGLDRNVVEQVLGTLEQSGLVTTKKIRLTMGGEREHIRSCSLTEAGRYAPAKFMEDTQSFILRAFITPIIVSALTTLATLWVSSLFVG
jgi:predicted transcriptional regulator